MTTEEKTTPTARAAETLRRQAGLAPPPGRGPRALARRALVRALRPYSHHQRELDGQIVAALRDQQAALERHGERIERLEGLVRELILTAESLRRASADAAGDAIAARRAIEPIAAELYAPPYIHGSPFRALQTPVGRALGFASPAQAQGGGDGSAEGTDSGLVVGVVDPSPVAGGEGARTDADYLAFERLFRGPAERVAELQRPYLALVREHQPVLDLGCGRGEFLGLLAQEGIDARGVDSDEGMVAHCRALGLEVAPADAGAHLEGLPDGSLGTVFSAQVIEHIPHQDLRALLGLALRKLRPGGLFIAETVNPHRISSLKTFWVDLTHQHPIFPEVALAICAIAGFPSAYVFAPGFDSFEDARLEAPSYAVVATAPDGTPREVPDGGREAPGGEREGPGGGREGEG